MTAVPHVLQAQRLFGEPDYLLRVATTDPTAFQHLYDQRLARLPGVRRLTSRLVMKNVVQDRPLPEYSPPDRAHAGPGVLPVSR